MDIKKMRSLPRLMLGSTIVILSLSIINGEIKPELETCIGKAAEAISIRMAAEQNSLLAYSAGERREGNSIWSDIITPDIAKYIQDTGDEGILMYDEAKENRGLIEDRIEQEISSVTETENGRQDEGNEAADMEGSGNDIPENKYLEIEYLEGIEGAYFYGRSSGDTDYVSANERNERFENKQEEVQDIAEGTAAIRNKDGEVRAALSQASASLSGSYRQLIQDYYIVDSSTSASEKLFSVTNLLEENLYMKKKTVSPQILIYHTHASEAYADSRAGVEADTVVGMGNRLTKLLEEKGYRVLHDKTAYDRKDGADNRNFAYSTARPALTKLLEENPSIEVIIDLHRDSGDKRVVEVDGVKMARIMLFNGLCRNGEEKIDYLDNPNLSMNLAFSLQMKLLGDRLYPGLFYRIYLKNYRYNMHLCEKYLLVELGTYMNTVKEARNAMAPLADVLDTLLSAK